MRITQTELIERVKKVGVMLINGNSREDILQLTSKKWKVSNRQIDEYIRKAKNEIMEGIKDELKYNYAVGFLRFQTLYKDATKQKDLRLAMTINKEILILQGVYKIQVDATIENNYRPQGLSHLTEDQIEALLKGV